MSFRGVSHELPHESLVPLGENGSESVPEMVLPRRRYADILYWHYGLKFTVTVCPCWIGVPGAMLWLTAKPLP